MSKTATGNSTDNMRIKLVLAIFALTTILSIPMVRFQHAQAQQQVKRQQLEQQVTNYEKLNTDAQKALEEKVKELDTKAKENEQLKKDLQSKRDKQAEDKRVAEEQSKKVAQVASPKVSASLGCESYRPLVSQYSWNVSVAMAIMQAESTCRSDAVSPLNKNGTRDYGLFQLNQMPVLDPAENVRLAYTQKYLKGGWKHWTVFNTGAYLRFM